MGVFSWAEQPVGQAATNGRASPTGGSAYGRAALDSELATLAAAAEGTRNDTLNRAAFNLAQLANRGHLNWQEVCAELHAIARRIGLTEKEISRTLASAAAGAIGKPRATVPDPDFQPAPPTPTVLADAVDDSGFWDSRPVLRHIRDFARSRRVGPWALLGITLARTIAMVPPSVVLPALVGSYASLNLFVGVVGRSGAGKGGAEAAAAEAVRSNQTVQTLTVGSGEAIAHAFMERRKNKQTDQWEIHQHTTRVLVSVAEVDTLGALRARTAATIMPELRKAWMGEQLGFHYVDLTKRLPVPAHCYRLCMVVGIQPERAATLLDDAAGGTPQRFVWVPATDPDAPDIAPTPVPVWDWQLPLPPVVNASGRAVLPVCDTARWVIDAAQLARLRGNSEALDGHALLARLKVAAGLALLDQRMEVGEVDWELAGTVMAVSEATRTAVVASLTEMSRRANVAKGKAEAQRAVIVDEAREVAAMERIKRVILRRLDVVGEDGETRGLLRRAVHSRDRGLFGQAIQQLVDEGFVDVEQGLRGPRYRRAK